ncbi:dihydrolipoamide acetyltransferase family protein [Mycobacterium sp. NPDC003449]
MPTVVRMPEVLANAGAGVIQTWLVAEGQQIDVGDPIAEIETDKAVVEYAAEVSGTVGRLLAAPGATIDVGEPIAVVLAPGEGTADLDAPAPNGTAVPAAGDRRLFATPLVRKLARERGIELASVTGTGPGGRIVRRDLDRLPMAEPVVGPPEPSLTPAVGSDAGNFTDIPLTGMRRAIARRLTESKTTVPHFYLVADCRVDDLLEIRRQVNEVAATKVSLTDFVLKAVAGALIEVPEANAIWNGDSVRRYHHADIALAVAVEGGLLTPVLREVDTTPLSTISERVADLAQRARDGGIRQQELEGGSFSVSNLGMFGVAEFSAILNPPQSGILAVGAAIRRPVVEDGALRVGTVMTVTLSADHRVIDGAVAARWMGAFVRRIENPLTILI